MNPELQSNGDFSLPSFPLRRLRQKEEGQAKGQRGVRVRALHVTSSRDCKTALYSPLSEIACVGFKSSVSVKWGLKRKRQSVAEECMTVDGRKSGCGENTGVIDFLSGGNI